MKDNKEQKNIKKGEEAGKLMWWLSYQKSRQSVGVIKCVKTDSTYGKTDLYKYIHTCNDPMFN